MINLPNCDIFHLVCKIIRFFAPLPLFIHYLPATVSLQYVQVLTKNLCILHEKWYISKPEFSIFSNKKLKPNTLDKVLGFAAKSLFFSITAKTDDKRAERKTNHP
ncbi:MAG: hypothetical protein P4L59_10050, partial [Desulfosporosinus sp.]|nr:hypothetical protein [Desulfosporosinus sp.]